MMKRVILIGAGGHAKVIADIIRLSGDTVVGCLDDNTTDGLPGVQWLGKTSDAGLEKNCYYFAAVGNTETRKRFMERRDIQWYTAIHPSAVIAGDVEIGDGVCVMANAVINPGTSIGRGSIVNTAATVDHECRIGQYVHISPGAHLAGSVTVDDGVWIGIGSCVINGIRICAGSIIGAGTVVIKDIGSKGTYVGVPACKKHD